MNRETLEEIRGLAAQMMESVLALALQLEPEPIARLLSLEQAAECLAVSRTTVQELVDSGKLPVVEVTGRAVRVDARDVEAYIKSKRTRRG